MNRSTLIQQLQTAIDEATCQQMYGNIEIEFRAGEAVFLRTTKTQKLDETENRRNGQNPRS